MCGYLLSFTQTFLDGFLGLEGQLYPQQGVDFIVTIRLNLYH